MPQSEPEKTAAQLMAEVLRELRNDYVVTLANLRKNRGVAPEHPATGNPNMTKPSGEPRP